MWAMVIVAVMVALTGFYRLFDKEGMAAQERAKAEYLADSMAIYRQAVITYFTRNPGVYNTVAINTLMTTNALPSWSTLYQQPASSIWTNYRHDDGVIYIYAVNQPPVEMSAELVKLSQNSVLAGVFRTGDTTLHSPVYGNTGVKLPPPAKAAIPNGSPVWVAMRQ